MDRGIARASRAKHGKKLRYEKAHRRTTIPGLLRRGGGSFPFRTRLCFAPVGAVSLMLLGLRLLAWDFILWEFTLIAYIKFIWTLAGFLGGLRREAWDLEIGWLDVECWVLED